MPEPEQPDDFAFLPVSDGAGEDGDEAEDDGHWTQDPRDPDFFHGEEAAERAAALAPPKRKKEGKPRVHWMFVWAPWYGEAIRDMLSRHPRRKPRRDWALAGARIAQTLAVSDKQAWAFVRYRRRQGYLEVVSPADAKRQPWKTRLSVVVDRAIAFREDQWDAAMRAARAIDSMPPEGERALGESLRAEWEALLRAAAIETPAAAERPPTPPGPERVGKRHTHDVSDHIAALEDMARERSRKALIAAGKDPRLAFPTGTQMALETAGSERSALSAQSASDAVCKRCGRICLACVPIAKPLLPPDPMQEDPVPLLPRRGRKRKPPAVAEGQLALPLTARR